MKPDTTKILALLSNRNITFFMQKTKIVDCSTWNEDTIRRRAEWIIDFMLKDIMPIPDEMRRRNNYNINSKKRRHLSFNELGIIGEHIEFIADPSISVKVVNDEKVEFEGKCWSLSPLTAELYKRRGKLRDSGTYSGTEFWMWNGIKLSEC